MTGGAILTGKERYHKLMGKHIYLSYTRLNIAYAVVVVSQFMHQPHSDHMEVVLIILRYLKGISWRGCLFRRNGNLEIQGIRDAYWESNPIDRRSTSLLLRAIW